MKPYELSVLINGELAFTTSSSRLLKVRKRLNRWARRNGKQIDKMPDDTLIDIVYRNLNEIKVKSFTKGELKDETS